MLRQKYRQSHRAQIKDEHTRNTHETFSHGGFYSHRLHVGQLQQTSMVRNKRRYPDGREAWLKLRWIYGGRETDERSIKLFAQEGKLRDIRRHSPEASSNFPLQLDSIWAEFEALGEILPQTTRKAALLSRKHSLPQTFARPCTSLRYRIR